MAKNKAVIVLKISADGIDQEFQLLEGKKFLVGRGPNCQLQLKAPNISTEHLELYFFESQLRIRDLNSANGTFRIPALAPFVEATFASRFDKLELLLAKSPLKLSWRPLNESETQVEKTIALNEAPKSSTKTQTKAAAPIAPQAEIKNDVDLAPSSIRKDGEKKNVDPNALPPHRLTTEELLQKLFPVGCGLLGTLLGFLLLKKQFLSALTQADPSQLAQGLGWDEFIVWYWTLVHQGWIFLVLLPGFFFLGSWLLKKRGKERLANVTSKQFLLTLLLSLLIVLSPWLSLISSGVSPNTWPLLISLTRSLENPKTPIKDKHALLKNALPRFRGSSYFYVKRFQVQTKRVIDECDGAGEKPWENKKVCLLLLHAVGVENLQDFSPVFLKDIAFRTSLILSLDGIVRVLAVEGKESKTLGYFLNSLSLVGLENEKAQIYAIVFEKDLTLAETQAVLQELRQSLEDRVSERFRELRLPGFLTFKIPPPIEVGI